jgi:hypothetical protein
LHYRWNKTPELQQKGFHTLTLFGLNTPAALFDHNHDAQRKIALQSAIDSLNQLPHYQFNEIKNPN